MVHIAERAEQIAGFLVAETLGANALKRPPSSTMDFDLCWPSGERGVLEVTILADDDAIRWQDQLADAGGSWDVEGRWELRLHSLVMHYRHTERAVRKVVALCNEHGADRPRDLPTGLRADDSVAYVENLGALRRVSIGREGVQVFQPTRAESIESTEPDFALLMERWAKIEHVRRHVAKTAAASTRHRHLFMVPLDDVLPARFFDDSFPAPIRLPEGYEGVDGLWVWSTFWKRFLGWRHGAWRWYPFPEA